MATREQATDAFFDLCEARGWPEAQQVLRSFLAPRVAALVELLPPERRREFVAVCEERCRNPVDAENAVYAVLCVGAGKSVVTCNGRPVSIPLPHAEAERIATRQGWG